VVPIKLAKRTVPAELGLTGREVDIEASCWDGRKILTVRAAICRKGNYV